MSAQKKGLRYADVVKLAPRSFAELEESTSYGTPALKLGGKLVTRLKEDGVTLVVRVDPEARDALLDARPKTFFVTDHYLASPFLLVDLATVCRDARSSKMRFARPLRRGGRA